MYGPSSPKDLDKEKMSAPAFIWKDNTCSECATPLPDGCKKKMCNIDASEDFEKSKQQNMQIFLNWFQGNLSQTFESFKESAKMQVPSQERHSKKRKRERSPSLSELSSGECSDTTCSSKSVRRLVWKKVFLQNT
ncbi:Hypothetical predicted protein [Pelobates cultripes]|uniref:Uncharacterized protein n=1 Tax=Pelobates cultripes TaxID=61616 RepID=A0AAD1SBZ6_PELCU|nr:Hypothetical predicted protein [Pelobates cultripes]